MYVFYGIIGEDLLPGLSFTSLYLQVRDSVNIFLLSSCLFVNENRKTSY